MGEKRGERFLLGTELIVGLGLAPGVIGFFMLQRSPGALATIVGAGLIAVSVACVVGGVWYLARRK